MDKLPQSFYTRNDVTLIAKELLGKKLCTNIKGKITAGIVTETEAYRGWGDKACHSHLGRRTNRTKIMYEEGGLAYVYLCYGIHHLFNIVTNIAGNGDAVLIRAIEPIEGQKIMLDRREQETMTHRTTTGPGSMSKALGIDKSHYGLSLVGNTIWIENGKEVNKKEIIASPRVGIDYAKEDALLPWRFRIKDNRWVSSAK